MEQPQLLLGFHLCTLPGENSFPISQLNLLCLNPFPLVQRSPEPLQQHSSIQRTKKNQDAAIFGRTRRALERGLIRAGIWRLFGNQLSPPLVAEPRCSFLPSQMQSCGRCSLLGAALGLQGMGAPAWRTEPDCPEQPQKFAASAPVSSLQELHDLGHVTPAGMCRQGRRKLEFTLGH